MSDTPKLDEQLESAVSAIDALARLIVLGIELERENAKLRAAVRWFRKYPEFVPNTNRMEEVVRDVRAVQSLFAEGQAKPSTATPSTSATSPE